MKINEFAPRLTTDMIEEITDNIMRYDVGKIRKCVREAKLHQLNGKCSFYWFEQVKRICNTELLRRKEPEEHGHY